jgi:hypothetical protein
MVSILDNNLNSFPRESLRYEIFENVFLKPMINITDCFRLCGWQKRGCPYILGMYSGRGMPDSDELP